MVRGQDVSEREEKGLAGPVGCRKGFSEQNAWPFNCKIEEGGRDEGGRERESEHGECASLGGKGSFLHEAKDGTDDRKMDQIKTV